MIKDSDLKKSNVYEKVLSFLANEKYQFFIIPFIAVLFSLLASSIIIIVMGKNPIDVFVALLQGAGVLEKTNYSARKGILTDFASMLNMLTPMIFAALAVAIAFKAGLFNIGVAGQMLAAGFIATITIGYSSLGAYVAKPLVLLVAAVVGGLVGILMGFLKYKFNINEVVSSIMLNYIIQYVTSFFINTYYVNTVSRQSNYINESASLTLSNVEVFGLKLDVPLGIILAIIAVLGLKFMLDKTKLGFEIKAIGANKKASNYAGMNVGKTLILTMFISGALAGLAGATYYLGYFNSIRPRTLSVLGFDSVAVSFLGNSNPLGIVFSSLLITIITKGSTYMSSSVGVSSQISSVITGLILLFCACDVYLKRVLATKQDKLDRKKEEKLEELNGRGEKA